VPAGTQRRYRAAPASHALLLHERDAKFSGPFDELVRSEGCGLPKTSSYRGIMPICTRKRLLRPRRMAPTNREVDPRDALSFFQSKAGTRRTPCAAGASAHRDRRGAITLCCLVWRQVRVRLRKGWSPQRASCFSSSQRQPAEICSAFQLDASGCALSSRTFIPRSQVRSLPSIRFRCSAGISRQLRCLFGHRAQACA
jgi:hypothetical protein